MQFFSYFKQHRKCLLQGVFCAALFIFAGLAVQMAIPSATPLAFKARLLYSGIAAALSMTLWRYTKKYILAFLLYTAFFLSSAFVPVIAGQQIERAEVAAAYLLGAMIFLFFTDLLYLGRHLPKRLVRHLVDVLLYACLAFGLLLPLFIWGYYAVSGRVLSATIVLTLFQTNGSESLAYLQNQNLFVWGGPSSFSSLSSAGQWLFCTVCPFLLFLFLRKRRLSFPFSF